MEYLILIWLHFLSDFVLQSDKMALNKSSDFKYLSLHCLVYSLPFVLISWKFAFVNGVLHLIVDFFSSKYTAYLWREEKTHWFFAVIGFDQSIHLSCLIITANWLSV